MSEHFKTKDRVGKIIRGLVIVCVIASLMGLIGLGKALYLKSTRPSAAKNAAYEYLCADDSVKERHGEKFSVDFLSVSVTSGRKNTKSRATVICRIDKSEYTLVLTGRNDSWKVDSLKAEG